MLLGQTRILETSKILDSRIWIVRMVDTGGRSAAIWEQETLDFDLSRSLTKPSATPSSSWLSLSPYDIRGGSLVPDFIYSVLAVLCKKYKGHIVVCLCRIQLVPGGDLIIISLPNFFSCPGSSNTKPFKLEFDDKEQFWRLLEHDHGLVCDYCHDHGQKENFDVSVILDWCNVFSSSFSCDPLFVSMSVL